MKLGSAGDALVREREGYKRALPNGDCAAYLCPAGVPTIGWGCTSGVHLGMVWTREQAEAGYRREMEQFENAVTRLVNVPLNQNEFDALVSLTYNIGEGGLAKSSILRRLNAGDREGAAAAFAMWNKARVNGRGPLVEMRGLTIRRAREAALFRTPADAADEPDMPQAVASEEPAPGLLHPKVHQELRQESWWYRTKHRILKMLGLGGAGGTAVASQLDADPVTMIGTVAQFAKAHGLAIVAAAVVAVIIFEAMQYAHRNNQMEPGP